MNKTIFFVGIFFLLSGINDITAMRRAREVTHAQHFGQIMLLESKAIGQAVAASTCTAVMLAGLLTTVLTAKDHIKKGNWGKLAALGGGTAAAGVGAFYCHSALHNTRKRLSAAKYPRNSGARIVI